MSSIPSNKYDEAIFAIRIIKKVTVGKTPGVGTHPPGRPRVNSTVVHYEENLNAISVSVRKF